MSYRGKRALITGGLGFIGSNLAIELVSQGAEVTIVDSLLAGCGGNLHNLRPVRDAVRILPYDITDAALFREDIARSDVIFNLAGEISHIHSMQFPERDLQVNTVAQLRFLLECQSAAPGIRIVYASTRQVYGVPLYLPVDEKHPLQPVDFNGVHKAAGGMYHLMLRRAGSLDAVVLRLTNVYGPRMALDVVCQGFLGAFVRKLMLKQRLEVFGDGTQLRDPIYVGDAVAAFLAAGLAAKCSPIFNVGGGEALSLSEIAHAGATAAGVGEPAYRPFPAELKPIDIGSYHTDSRLIRKELGWSAAVRFAEGIARTLAYYEDHLSSYLNPRHENPPCKMPEHAGAPRRLTYSEV